MSWFDCRFPCTAPSTLASEAVGLIAPYDYLVITEHGTACDRFLGIVTLHQLLPLLANPEAKPTLASLMDSSAIAINQQPALQRIISQPDWCPMELQCFMAEQQISHLPILDNHGVAIAVITYKNLAQCIAQRSKSRVIATKENYLLTLNKIQSLLWEEGTYRNKLQEFINLLGQSSTASRAYIFAYHRNQAGQILASQLVEWCAEGITPQIDNPELQNLPMETCAPNMLSAHCQGQPFAVLVREFSGIEKEILQKQGILSILFLPIMVQGECWGALGFDDCLQERIWQNWEIAYLEIAAKVLANTIQKEETEVFYESLFDHSTDAIFLVDTTDFKIIDANQRAVELFEADSIDELVGIHGKSLHRYPETDGELITEHQTLEGNYWYCEIEYRTLKGNTFWGAMAGKKLTIAGTDYLLIRVADISDRKRSEQLLKEQKEFLQSIYEGSGQAIFIIDVTSEGEFIFRDANPTFERLTNLKRSHIANKKPVEVFPPDIAKSAIENYRRCIVECRTITYEEYAPLHTGASWWVTTLTPLYDAEDRPYRIIGTSIEISDRKKAEQALRDSELLLKETEAISKVGGWFIDLKTKRGECTDELQEILGLPKGLIKFSPLQNPEFYLSFLDTKDRRRLQCAYGQLVKKRIELDLELPLTTIDGTHKWVRISARPICDPQSQEIIRISGSVSDITDKKQMELNLKASETRFRTLIENLNVGVLLFDASGKIQLFNSKALELLGLSAEQVQSKTAFDPQWRTINPDGSVLPPEQYPISIALKTRQAVRNVVLGVYRRQDDLVWLLVHADPQFYPQRGKEKELFNVVVCFTDITEEYARTAERIFSESRYRQIIQTQHEYVLVSLPDTRIVFANNSLCQALGMTSEEVKNKTWSDIMPPEELAILQTKIAQLSPQNPTFENTNANFLADGKTGWTQWLNQGFFDEMGNLTEIQSIGRDITPLKLLQAELERTASYYKSLIENSSDLILVLNQDAYLTYVSPSSFHILGYIPPEMEGQQILEFLHPDYHELVKHTINRSLSAPFDTLPDVEFLLLGKDSQWRWFAGTVTNLLDDMAVQGIVMNCHDISDRKRLQNELTNSLFYFQQLIDNVPAVVYRYTLRPDGSDCYEYLSENIVKMYALPRQAVLEDISLFWEMVHPSDRQRVREALKLSAENRTPLFIDYRLISADGKLKWIQEKSQPSYRDNGEVVWDGVMLDITELKEQQELFSNLVSSCLAIIYIYDVQENRNVYVNQEIEQVLGYTPQEIQALGDRLAQELIHPEDLPLLMKNMEYLVSNPKDTDTSLETIYRMRRKDGTYRWLLSRERVFLHDNQGNVKQIIGVATDITQLKTTELMLTESEERLSAFLDNIPGLVSIKDLEGRYLFANHHYLQTFGISPEQILGKTNCEFLPESVAQIFRDNTQQVLASQQTQVFEEEYWWNGKHYVNLSTRFPLFDVSGNIYAIGCVSIDISDRITVERELRDREARLQSIFRNIPVAVYSYIPNEFGGKFIYLSDNASELFEISSAQIQDNANLLWNLLEPSYLPALQASVAEASRNLSPWSMEFPITLPSGMRKWIRGEAECTLHPDGTYTWDGVLIDITASKQIEASLRESEQRLLQIIHNVPVAIYRVICDSQQQYWVTYVSPNFWELLGIAEQPLPVPMEQIVSVIHPEDRQHVLEVVKHSTRTLSRCYKEFRVGNKWLIADGVPMLRSNGEIVWDGILQDITEHKDLIETLEELNAHLQVVVQSSQVGFYLTDLITGKSYVSPAYKAQLGYPPDSPHGVPREWHDRLHPEDKERAIRAFEAFLQQEVPTYNIDFRLRHRDGSYRWIASMAKLITDEAGKPIKVVGCHIDITERKEMEEQLRQSEMYFRQIFEYSPIGMLIVSAEHRITAVNQVLCAMLDYTPEELLGREIWQFIHPEDVLTAQLRYTRASASPSETSYNCNIRLLCKGGDFLWTMYSVVLLWNAEGQVINRIIAVEDITPFREAQAVIENANARLEAIVKERTEALEISQSLLRQQLEKNQLLLRITERIRSTTKLDEVLYRAVSQVRSILHADRVLIYRFFNDTAQGGVVMAEAIADGVTSLLYNSYPAEVFPPDCHAEFYYGKVSVISNYQQSDLSPCLKDFMASIHVSAGIVAGIVKSNSLWGTIIVHSQTPRQWKEWEMELVEQLCTPLGVAILQSELYQQLENELEIRRKAEQELQVTNAELIRANRLKDEFLANMSHELRTPLNSILGLTEGLLQEVYGKLNSKQMHYLQTIERSGKHLLELINDILDLAKIEAGATVLNLSEVNIFQLCEATLAFVRPQALRKGIHLSLEIAVPLETMIADERQLRQLLLNLLSNAVKFTNSGGSVLLRVSQQGDMISFAVSDTGIGIAEADMPKLFKPFSQVDSNLTRRYSGTGLGLALVKRIAELHGGTVSVTSKLGEGSCFTALIPSQCGELLAKKITTAEQKEQPTTPSTQQRNRLILLVEDNDDNIETLQDYLQAHGYTVLVVHNGREAIEAVLEHSPDLVLMDAQMPEMDGFSATAQIRAMPQFANLPIIIVTALSMDGDRQKAMSAGATAYLSKPFSLRKLVQKIDKLLNIN